MSVENMDVQEKEFQHHWILEGTTPRAVSSAECHTWMLLCPLARFLFKERVEGVIVSTIFLPWNLQTDPTDPTPILFETMVQDDNLGWLDYQTRGSTYLDALKMHSDAVAWVRAGMREGASG